MHLAESYPIADVRGRGLMVAVEFGGANRESEGAPYGVAAKVVAAARDRGLLLLTAGEDLDTTITTIGTCSPLQGGRQGGAAARDRSLLLLTAGAT